MRHTMRHLLQLTVILAALAAALPAAGQVRQPIPEPPPPPPGFELDPAMEPQVTIRKRGDDTVEEYRIAGKLYMLKVTPPGGRPYYMIDGRGDGKFIRQDSYDEGVRPPMWVIHSW